MNGPRTSPIGIARNMAEAVAPAPEPKALGVVMDAQTPLRAVNPDDAAHTFVLIGDPHYGDTMQLQLDPAHRQFWAGVVALLDKRINQLHAEALEENARRDRLRIVGGDDAG